ncbi:MAG: carbohydrate-binding domain-containing protein [Corallococcus sp.]|nr:carbohydrate-binding domain-containing protein [Corallococcus sp.]MCM1360167.1 carbohydrate-binding domain-containing protein [Corallococcus sp.]MCM1395764.1 carbohydrate-binding domain-containing protein [Corallococcus sp.]
MKKSLTALAIATLLILICVFTSCAPSDPFVNPGDKLGGGGVGEVAYATDTSRVEKEMNDVISGLSLVSGDESLSNAVSPVAVDGVVTVTESGTYLLSGVYKQIVIGTAGINVVFILNGATIGNDNGVAIDGTSVKKLSVTLTAVQGTENTIENSGDGFNAVHIKGALTVNGRGSLSVNSNGKSALKASKNIEIVDVNMSLFAVNHGIAGANVAASNCTINVTSAGKDGINAECDDVTEYVSNDGYVYLDNVDYNCVVNGDGVQADTWLFVDGGNYNVTTNGTFVANTTANMQEYGMTNDDFRYIKSGSSYKKIASDETNRYSTRYGLVQSAKGFKVGEIKYVDSGTNEEVVVTEGNYCIKVIDGTFDFDCTDDAIHANSGDVIITGGTFTISTFDDGITADGLSKISGGDVQVVDSYEGIEGAYVEIGGGTVSVWASDDGINAASDDSAVVEHIIISGGTVTVNASGDGLDSNGSILISGGVVVVHGPSNGGDAGLDADRGIVVTGGTLFATSTLGMVETPSTNSTQYVISYAQRTSIIAGTNISLVDSSGTTLLTVAVQKNCQSLILSVAGVKKDASYSIYGGDTELAKFTVNSVITTVGSSQQSGNPGGMPGGGRPPR